jgi:GTP1/Obg family GTP-binding protein
MIASLSEISTDMREIARKLRERIRSGQYETSLITRAEAGRLSGVLDVIRVQVHVLEDLDEDTKDYERLVQER